MNNSTILLVDDEKEIRELISIYLKKEGFYIIEASNAIEALTKVKNSNPHLIVLDVFLPDLDGIELCRQLRNLTSSPILFLSCKDSEIDKVTGLSVGADDYIGKPFSIHELIARIKAHLRRNLYLYGNDHVQKEDKELRSKSVSLNIQKHECYFEDKLVSLTSKEFQLLSFFMSHPQQVFSSVHLLEKVWGYESFADLKTVMVHIGKIRKKLGGESKNPPIIQTIRGVGYKFNEEIQKFY
ncbi:response regulator transcription factor [Bacillus sp. AFS029533]|uniref:response regulator transcription factor n=1 Tax=Bacillus sp. AFS029533 TaxID=2033494 RepID=UPI000BFDE28A|nr:response regulator transcription factor [Bacillus sp. AFS029533]PGZ92272.1 DNA-binding response regulator [Bacillus sp. AFS029533]